MTQRDQTMTKWLLASLLLGMLKNSCGEVVTCSVNVPSFKVHDSSFVLPNRKQILFPSQKFTCSGSIKQWGVAVKGQGNLHLQVWRPSPAGTMSSQTSFQLIGTNIFTLRFSNTPLLYLMPDKKRTLDVQSGDILGLYIDSRGEYAMRVSYLYNLSGSAFYAYDADTPMNVIEPNRSPNWVWLNAAPIMIVLLDSSSVVKADITTLLPHSTTETPAPIPTQAATNHATQTPPTTSTSPDVAGTTLVGATPTTTKFTPTTTPTTGEPARVSFTTLSKLARNDSVDYTTTIASTSSSDLPTMTTAQPKFSSKDEPGLAAVLVVAITTTAAIVGALGACAVSVAMVLRQLRLRMERAQLRQLHLHKVAALTGPPPTSPPPAPPIPHYENLTLSSTLTSKKDRSIQGMFLTASLTSSLTSSLLWWLPKKGTLQIFVPREYETPIVTKSTTMTAALERSYNHYDIPTVTIGAAASRSANGLTRSCSHHYEEVV